MNIAMSMVSHLQKNIGKIEKALSYNFQNQQLLMQAFMDSSFPMPEMIMENGETNENLVWRGNYLLQLVIADEIQANHHTASKAEMNKMISELVGSASCVKFVDKLKIFNYYLHQVQRTGALISPEERDKPFKEKCFKALLSAIYLDSGKDFSKTMDFFTLHFSDELENTSDKPTKNWKSLLCEWAQQNHICLPKFAIVDQKGPAHAPQFTVQVFVNGETMGNGISSSKKDAEQIAAKVAYEKLVEKREQ